MAYQIKKSNKIVEDLEFLDENNNVAETVHIEIDVDRIAKYYREIMVELAEAEKLQRENDVDALETYGNAVIKLFQCVFGEQNTAKVLAYFEDKYTEMAVQCMPFITNVVKPAIEKSTAMKREIMANNYNLSKNQRKNLGLR